MEEPDVKIIKIEPYVLQALLQLASHLRGMHGKSCGMGRAKRAVERPRSQPDLGFNNPDPTPGFKDYGYEFWIKIEHGMALDDDGAFKEFDGGFYSVNTCKALISPWKDTPETWGKLASWVKNSKYQFGKHQYLEKAYDPLAPDDKLVLDLYAPIVQ